MSGGGVGAIVWSYGGMRTPATSPTYASWLSSCRYETWCEACPGVYATRKPSTVSPPFSAVMRSSGTGATSPQSSHMSSP